MRRAGSDSGQAQRNVLGVEAEPCFQWGRLGIDVSISSACVSPMKIIVGMPSHSIEDPFVMGKILPHLAGRRGGRVSDSSPTWSWCTTASGLRVS